MREPASKSVGLQPMGELTEKDSKGDQFMLAEMSGIRIRNAPEVGVEIYTHMYTQRNGERRAAGGMRY